MNVIVKTNVKRSVPFIKTITIGEAPLYSFVQLTPSKFPHKKYSEEEFLADVAMYCKALIIQKLSDRTIVLRFEKEDCMISSTDFSNDAAVYPITLDKVEFNAIFNEFI